ncbi:MAG: YitT family protein [Draconibacterium sp.]
MKKFFDSKVAKVIYDYTIITVGMLLYVLGWALFIIPAKITGGGISGISVVINYATGFPIWISFLIINAVLLLIALKVLGASFGIKTVWCLGWATVLFAVTTPELIGKWITIPIVEEKFLAAVIGAMMGGIGIGLVFTRGGSTGGTDVIAMIVNKYRNISPGRVILYCDVIIISSSYFIANDPAAMVYGFVTMWVISYSIDSFLSGSNASAQIFIFSTHFKEIADYINHDAHRGCTILEGTGWYSKENVKIVMTVIRKRESSLVFRKLKEIDPNAFISMGSVMGVYGEGFDNIKI